MIGWSLLCAGAALAADGSTGMRYDGRAHQMQVEAPRVDTSIVLDGSLDEPVWNQAAVLTGFSEYIPVDGPPAADSTEVLVWYSPKAIYFGIRARAAPGSVHAALTDRDQIYKDDWIGIFLSTLDDHRTAVVFAVNPLGVQGDGILAESGVPVTGGGREPINTSPDFVFQSRGRITSDGYVIEVRVPFQSLQYQPRDPQTWGINVIRHTQSSQHEDSWAPAVRTATSFLAQSGALVSLTGLRRGVVLDLNPEVAQQTVGAPGSSGWNYDAARPQPGFYARWGVTNSVSLNATVHPDFAQIESDATQLVYDPRLALFYEEKRPFFLDGSAQYATPDTLIYTRRILQPQAALTLAGTVARTNVAALWALDSRDASAGGTASPMFDILRVQQNVGRQSKVGVTFTERDEAQGSNRVYGTDGRFVFNRARSAQFAVAQSRTVDPDGTNARNGVLWMASADQKARAFGARLAVVASSDDYETQSGFISETGVAKGSLDTRWTVFGRQGSPLESWSARVSLLGTWTYASLVAGLPPRDRYFHVTSTFLLRGGWSVSQSVFLESFGLPNLYGDYGVERHLGGVVDTVPFVGVPRLPNRDWVISFSTPQLRTFIGDFFVIWGKDDNFSEWASASIMSMTANAYWKPTDKFRVTGSYNLQLIRRRSDGSPESSRHIPRVTVEYQLARPLFIRLVSQYDAQFRDALRDDAHAGDPILLRDPTTLQYSRSPALAQRLGTFTVNWLVSYRPGPGTVVYAGYGTTLSQPAQFPLRGLHPAGDAFFVKLSYLYRL